MTKLKQNEEMSVSCFALPNGVKKALAVYFSLGLILGGLGVGLASGQEKDKPIKIGQAPVVQEMADRAFPQAAASTPAANDAPEVILAETKVPQTARNLDFLLSAPFPEPLVQVYQTLPWNMMPNAIGKDAKPATEAKKHSNTIWWILGGILAVVGGYFIYKAVTKKTTTPTYTPTYKETTQTGTIKDVLTNATLAGIVLEYDDINKDRATVHETYTTDGSGVYTLMYKEGTNPNITIRDPTGAHNTRTTYPKWGPEYLITPSSFDTATFHQVMRSKPNVNSPDFITMRWTKQPTKYIIVTQDMDDRTKGFIYDVLKTNEIELLTGGKIKGTTSPEEVASTIDYPNKYTWVYEFRSDFTTNSIASTLVTYDSSTYEITGVIVKININRRAYVLRKVILHETGHGAGHWGHGTKYDMLMADSANRVTDHVTQWDIDNGTVAYNRPCGNTYPDNDPATGGANKAANGFVMANNSSVLRPSFIILPSGSQGVSVGSFKLPGRQSGKATVRDLVAMLPDMQVQDGKFGLALNPAMARLQLGLGDEKAGVATTLTNNGYGPADFTTAAQVQKGIFTGGAQYSTSSRNLQAGGGVKLGNVQVGVYGSFDASRKVNTFNFGISPVQGVVFGYGNSGKYHVINASANLGGKVIVDSSANIAPENLDFALRVSAMLGRAVIYGSFDQSIHDKMKTSSGNVALYVPIGPGGFEAGLFTRPGQANKPKLDFSIRYRVIIPVF
jgi:hypothetical protein